MNFSESCRVRSPRQTGKVGWRALLQTVAEVFLTCDAKQSLTSRPPNKAGIQCNISPYMLLRFAVPSSDFTHLAGI